MAETNTTTTSSGSAPQPNGVTPVIFWIVSAVLALAIGGVYFLVNKDLDATRTNVNDALIAANKSQDAKTEKAVGDAKQLLNAEIAKLQEENKKLAETNKGTADSLATLTKTYEGFVKNDLPVLQKKSDKHESEIATTKTDLSQTNANVNKVETEVKYLKENIDKINGKLLAIDKDIGNLSSSSVELKAELKKEYDAISKEVAEVNRKGGSTREDMEKLKNRTLEFEVKVLNERAKQAAAFARKGDHKSALEMLDFKGN